MTTTTSPDSLESPLEFGYVVPLIGERRTRHLTRLLEMREMFARLSTERYCHGLSDATDAFNQMVNVEEEVALLYPDVHARLFPQWVSQDADTGHEPGQYNANCGICRACQPGNQLDVAA
jgi:hypothetical protein